MIPSYGWQRPALASTSTLLAATVLAACANTPAALTQSLEARRIASELHVEFTKASEASGRTVMADTDEQAAAAAHEARRARQLVERDLDALQSILDSAGYHDDLRYLAGFKLRLDEYQRLDDEILALAVENTNLKAQRMAFGAGREAADALRMALDALRTRTSRDVTRVDTLTDRVRIGVLEIQVLQARHIPESEDAEMTRIENEMTASAEAARRALAEIRANVPSHAGSAVSAAATALEQFLTVNSEIVKLSRRNSDVRSVALSLGRKRAVTAECEDQLQALEQSLAKHDFAATR